MNQIRQIARKRLEEDHRLRDSETRIPLTLLIIDEKFEKEVVDLLTFLIRHRPIVIRIVQKRNLFKDLRV